MQLFRFSIFTCVRKSFYGHLLWPGVLCGIRVVLVSSFLQAYGLLRLQLISAAPGFLPWPRLPVLPHKKDIVLASGKWKLLGLLTSKCCVPRRRCRTCMVL